MTRARGKLRIYLGAAPGAGRLGSELQRGAMRSAMRARSTTLARSGGEALIDDLHPSALPL
ncbi:hypothetical protein [Streptomyces griseorubiginosus]|uniref:hypothetical protein n=1 Tax=Streptomyces griseorubiginosus TaxID=67304 RepID=UPI003331801D